MLMKSINAADNGMDLNQRLFLFGRMLVMACLVLKVTLGAVRLLQVALSACRSWGLYCPPPPKKKTFLVFKLPQCLLLWQKPLHFLFMSLVCICLEQMHTQTKTFAGSDYGNQWSKSGSTPIYKKQPDNHPSNYTAQASTLLRLTFFFSLI